MLALSADHSNTLWTILSALGVILTVIATPLRARKDRTVKQAETQQQIAAVQDTVNGNTSVLTERAGQLVSALSGAGVTVPPKPPALLEHATVTELQAALEARRRDGQR